MRPRGRGSLSFEAGPALSWLTARRLNSLAPTPSTGPRARTPAPYTHSCSAAALSNSSTYPTGKAMRVDREACMVASFFFCSRAGENDREKKRSTLFFFFFSTRF